MTLGPASSAAAAVPAVEPDGPDGPTERERADEDMSALTALLTEPSVVTSEKWGSADTVAASRDADAATAPSDSSHGLPTDGLVRSTVLALPAAAAQPHFDAAVAHSMAVSPAVEAADIEPLFAKTSDVETVTSGPAEVPARNGDASPDRAGSDGGGEGPAAAGPPAPEPATAPRFVPPKDAADASSLSLPGRNGGVATDTEHSHDYAFLRGFAGMTAISPDDDTARMPDDPAAMPEGNGALARGGSCVPVDPPDEVDKPAGMLEDTRLDDIADALSVSSDDALHSSISRTPDMARASEPETGAPEDSEAYSLPCFGDARLDDIADAPSVSSNDALPSSPSHAPGLADPSALEDITTEDREAYAFPLSDDALLQEIADAPSVSSEEMVQPARAPIAAPDDVHAEDDPDAPPVADPVPFLDEHPSSEFAYPPEAPGEGPGGAYGDMGLEAVPPGPVAALAFAVDPDTEVALRDGLFGYEAVASECGEPQVWQGGLRAAIEALSDGHSAPLIFVDVDGIPYPAGAIHELAAVCEVGTLVIAVGSDATARPGRELLLAGVSDYLAKPLTAQAVRVVLDRIALDATPGRGGGCVAGFLGSGGSGTTTLAVATALQAAARGCYVSVLDLSRSVGAAALALGVEPAAGLDQLLEAAERSTPEPEMVDGVCARRSDRIEVYAYRWSPTPPPAPSPAAVHGLLAAMRMRSQLVLVDGFDGPQASLFSSVGIDTRVFVAEPTAGRAAYAARMMEMLGADPSPLLVQNHTRVFKRGAGARALRNAGMPAEPDVVIPFESSVPAAAAWGWPQARLPRSLRNPVTALTDRLLAPPPAIDAAAAPHLRRES